MAARGRTGKRDPLGFPEWQSQGLQVASDPLGRDLFGFWELKLPGGLTQAASKSYAGTLAACSWA